MPLRKGLSTEIMDEEKAQLLKCAVKALEAEFGVSVMVFVNPESRDKVKENLAFAERVKAEALIFGEAPRRMQ